MLLADSESGRKRQLDDARVQLACGNVQPWGFDRRRAIYVTFRLDNRKVRYSMATDTLSITLSALADPTRRSILARLAEGAATVKELSSPFAMSGPAISKHLRVLERAGLITRGREAQWRPCRLEAAPLEEVAEWAEEFRRFWDESYDRLDDYLRHLQREEMNDDDR
jgi:DNA-binding transcriptional ArsR family regulator